MARAAAPKKKKPPPKVTPIDELRGWTDELLARVTALEARVDRLSDVYVGGVEITDGAETTYVTEGVVFERDEAPATVTILASSFEAYTRLDEAVQHSLSPDGDDLQIDGMIAMLAERAIVPNDRLNLLIAVGSAVRRMLQRAGVEGTHDLPLSDLIEYLDRMGT